MRIAPQIIAALKADRSVVTWGSPDYGGDCCHGGKVQEQLTRDMQSVCATSEAFVTGYLHLVVSCAVILVTIEMVGIGHDQRLTPIR